MIGTSVSGLITTFQFRAAELLKETDGDIGNIVNRVIQKMEQQDLLTKPAAVQLKASYAEALDVLAGKANAKRALVSSRKRLAELTAAGATTHATADVASVLAELCHSLIVDAALRPRVRGTKDGSKDAGVDPSRNEENAPIILAATVSGKGPQAALWGVVGAFVGESMRGPLGAVIGAGVGAAVGSCGDSDTTITPTNGGGSPT